MKKAIVAALIGSASLNAGAAGFAPWAHAAKPAVESAQERAQVPASGPFYRVEPPRGDTPDPRQAEVRIKPWYLDAGA